MMHSRAPFLLRREMFKEMLRREMFKEKLRTRMQILDQLMSPRTHSLHVRVMLAAFPTVTTVTQTLAFVNGSLLSSNCNIKDWFCSHSFQSLNI